MTKVLSPFLVNGHFYRIRQVSDCRLNRQRRTRTRIFINGFLITFRLARPVGVASLLAHQLTVPFLLILHNDSVIVYLFAPLPTSLVSIELNWDAIRTRSSGNRVPGKLVLGGGERLSKCLHCNR